MYNVSNGFKEAIASASRLLFYSVLINDLAIPNENITSLELSDSINNGDTFSIGRTITNTLNLKLSNIGGFSSNQIVKPSLAIEVKNGDKVSMEYVPLGVFYIVGVEENKGEVTLSCYDKMSFLDEEYIPVVSKNSTPTVVMNDICNQLGITFKGSLRNVTLEGSITGYSYREMIGFIASIEGGNAKFDRNGNLIIKRYEVVQSKITPQNYSDFSFTEMYSITGIAAHFGDVSNKRGDYTGHCVTFSNPFITDSNIDEIYNRLKGLRFVPSTIEYRGDFSIDAGDIVTIEDLNGDEYLLLISQNNLSFSGGLTGRISSIGESKSTNEIKEYKFKNKKSLTELNIKLGQIQAVVQGVEKSQNDLDERIKKAELEITAESIAAKVEDVFIEKDELNNYSTTYQMNSAIKAAKDSITQTVSDNFYSKNEFANSSTLNLISNGGFENGTEYWSRNGDFTDGKDIWVPHNSSNSWVIWADANCGFYQFFSCQVGKTYSWSIDVYVERGRFRAGIEELNEEWYYATNGWTKMKGTFTATRDSHAFVLYAVDNYTIVHFDNVMVCEGTIPHPYQPDYIDINSRLRLAEQKITPDAIINTVKEEVYTKTETENAITSKGYATSTQLQQTATNFTYKFSQSGGYNLIRNGNPKPWHEENWWVSGNGWWYRGNSSDLGIQTSDTNEAYAGTATFKVQPGTNYSLSCWLFAEYNTKGSDVYFIGSSEDNGAYEDVQHLFSGGKDGWTKVERTFTTGPNTQYGFIRIDNNGIIDVNAGYNVVFFSEVQLVNGWECYPQWSPNPNETYDGITTIDKNGVKVTSSNINGYTQMTADGFFVAKDGTEVFKVDGRGLAIRGSGANSGRYIKIENEDYTVWNGNTNCMRFGYKNWNGWDGVPEFLMGYRGMRYSDNAWTGEDASYFGMQTWGRWVKNNEHTYHDIYYRSDHYGDQHHIRFTEDGLMQLRTLKRLELKAGSNNYIQIDTEHGVGFPQGVKTFGVNDSIWLSNSNFGVTWGKYSGKELYNLRPTSNNFADLGHESYRWRTIYATNGSINTSDISLKENINPIPNERYEGVKGINNTLISEDFYSFVKELPLYTYDYKSEMPDRSLHNIGFIAQDIADSSVGQEFVFKGEDGIYQYNMQGYVGVLAVALQSALKKIDILEEKVSQLESKF